MTSGFLCSSLSQYTTSDKDKTNGDVFPIIKLGELEKVMHSLLQEAH